MGVVKRQSDPKKEVQKKSPHIFQSVIRILSQSIYNSKPWDIVRIIVKISRKEKKC